MIEACEVHQIDMQIKETKVKVDLQMKGLTIHKDSISGRSVNCFQQVYPWPFYNMVFHRSFLFVSG